MDEMTPYARFQEKARDSRDFPTTSTAALKKLSDGLEAVVKENAADHGVLTCALLLTLIQFELARRKAG